MRIPHKTLFAALAAAGLAIAFNAAADVRTDSTKGYDQDHMLGRDITFRGDEVVITAQDASEALITRSGKLTIRGHDVAVTGEQRALLRQYTAGILEIQARGKAIGKDAADMGTGMMGVIMADLFTYGDNSKQMNRDVKASAEPLKEEARALCTEVHQERDVQDRLATELPEFRPYAVIDTDSENDCHVDDNDED